MNDILVGLAAGVGAGVAGIVLGHVVAHLLARRVHERKRYDELRWDLLQDLRRNPGPLFTHDLATGRERTPGETQQAIDRAVQAVLDDRASQHPELNSYGTGSSS